MTGLGRRMLAPVSPRFYDSTTPEACTNFASLLPFAVYTPFYVTSLRDLFTGSSTTWRGGIPEVPGVLLTDWIGARWKDVTKQAAGGPQQDRMYQNT